MASFQEFGKYNPFFIYCRELAPGTVSLTGDWAQGDDSKHDLHYIPDQEKGWKQSSMLNKYISSFFEKAGADKIWSRGFRCIKVL